MPVPGQKSKKQKQVPPFAVDAIDQTVPLEVAKPLPPAPTAPVGTKAFEKQWKEANKVKGKAGPASKEVQAALIHGTGPARGLPVAEDETFPLDDPDEKRVLEQRKGKRADAAGPVGVDHAMYAEIGEFEKRVGHPWWKFAHKNEPWSSYKARGCPLELPRFAALVASGPPEVPATQRGYAGLAQTSPDAPKISKAVSGQPKPSSPVLVDPKRREKPPSAKPAPIAKPEPAGDAPPSNKEIVYKEWLKVEGTPDIAAVAKLVPEVSLSSVKSWMGAWAKGNNFPACSKELPPSLKGKYGKPVEAPRSPTAKPAPKKPSAKKSK